GWLRLPGISQPAAARRGDRRAPAAGPVPDPRFSGPLGRSHAPHVPLDVGLLGRRGPARTAALDLGRVPGAADRDRDQGHPLRHQVVEVRHGLGRRLARHPAGRGRDRRDPPRGVLRRRLHHQPAAGRGDRRPGLGRLHLRRGAAGPGARRPGPPAGAPPLLLEERQVGAWPGAGRARPARLLGDARLPQPRRPLARAAVPGGL
ncbi:MAG: conserved hypothetical protein, partial [uncultured Thermomicrobiales bacterium]